MAMVGAFLALHTLNLFMFVFPAEQSQWAWLGFGFTSIGALGYLAAFKWLSKTTLQKVVDVLMTFVCFISEAVAAFFGMQVETWRKMAWTFTQEDINTILTIIGLLGVLHFFALIAHLAGDSILELFQDEDGDGIPNHADKDWKGNQKPASPAAANSNGQSKRLRTYTLPEMLTTIKMSRDEFKYFLEGTGNTYTAWTMLDREGRIPADMGMKNFSELASAVVGQKVNP
jgi:uncharacterized membrane protein